MAMDGMTRALSSISPLWGKKVAAYGGTNPVDPTGQYGPTDEEDGVLKNLASQTIQPYHPGWAALPGVAASLVGGMASAKLRDNAQQRQGIDTASYNNWVQATTARPGGQALAQPAKPAAEPTQAAAMPAQPTYQSQAGTRPAITGGAGTTPQPSADLPAIAGGSLAAPNNVAAPQAQGQPPPSATTPPVQRENKLLTALDSQLAAIDRQKAAVAQMGSNPRQRDFAEKQMTALDARRVQLQQHRNDQDDPMKVMLLEAERQKIDQGNRQQWMQEEALGLPHSSAYGGGAAGSSSLPQSVNPGAVQQQQASPTGSVFQPNTQSINGSTQGGIKMNPNAPDIRLPELSPEALRLKKMANYYGISGNKAGQSQAETELNHEPSYAFRTKEIERLGVNAGKRAADNDAGAEALDVFDKMSSNADAWFRHAPGAANGAIGRWQSTDTYQGTLGMMNPGAQNLHTRLSHDADAVAVQLRKISGGGHSSDASDKTFKEAIGKAIQANDYQSFRSIMDSARNVIVKAAWLPSGYKLPGYDGKITPQEANAINLHATNPIKQGDPNVDWGDGHQLQQQTDPQQQPVAAGPHPVTMQPGSTMHHPKFGPMEKHADGKWYPAIAQARESQNNSEGLDHLLRRPM